MSTNLAITIKTGVAGNKSLASIYASLGGAADKAEFYAAALELMESGGIPNVMECFCGHDCARCLTFRATVSGDEALRERSAAFYKADLGLDVPPEKLRCFGGRSDERMELCSSCPFMSCCKEKGLASCPECPEYPCETLGWYIKKYVNKVNQTPSRRPEGSDGS